MLSELLFIVTGVVIYRYRSCCLSLPELLFIVPELLFIVTGVVIYRYRSCCLSLSELLFIVTGGVFVYCYQMKLLLSLL